MAVSNNDIVNVALRLLGTREITSLTDGTANANAANDLFAETRDDLLRQHNWNFATKRSQLAQSATTPGFEFDYAYVLPSDWLRTISVHDNDGGYGTVYFKSELVGGEQCLCSNVAQLYLRYVAAVTDPNKMTADFRRALAHAMARDLALAIESSNVVQEQLAKAATRSLARARSADAMGSYPERRPRGSWVTSRGGRGGYWSDEIA